MVSLDLLNIGLLGAVVMLVGFAVYIALQWLGETREGNGGSYDD